MNADSGRMLQPHLTQSGQKSIPPCGIKHSQGRLEPNDANTASPWHTSPKTVTGLMPPRPPEHQSRCPLLCPPSLFHHHVPPKFVMPGITPLKQPAPSLIALPSISACIAQTTTRSFTKITRCYTASTGGTMVLDATGNLLLPPPTDHNSYRYQPY